MIIETTEGALRQNLGEMLGQVRRHGESIVINEDGRPVAALVDIALFEQMRRMHERLGQLSARFAAAFAATPEADGVAEIEALVAADRGDPARS